MGGFNGTLFNGPGSATGATGASSALTAGSLIYGALRLLGVLRAGQGTNPESLADGLNALNDMVDAWNLDRLKIPTLAREEFPIAGPASSYSMGPGGTINAASRPVRLDSVGFQLTAGAQTIERPLRVLTLEQYAAIAIKGTAADWPTALYCDYAFPNANVSLYPEPANGGTLVVYDWQQLAAFVDLATTYTVPQGYALALRYNLAVQIAPMFVMARKTKEVLLPQIIMQARQSLADVRQANAPRPVMRCDPAVTTLSRRRGGWSTQANGWIR